MSKRGADHQLTKNDVEAGEDDMEQQQDAGPWRGADQSKLKQRVIVRARRKMGDDSVPTAGGISAVDHTHTQPSALCMRVGLLCPCH